MTALFGAEGELSRKSFHSRRKAFRTSTICLTASFLVLSVFLEFVTVSEVSTTNSYIERYQDSWDVMVGIRGSVMDDVELMKKLRDVEGVANCTIYQKKGCLK